MCFAWCCIVVCGFVEQARAAVRACCGIAGEASHARVPQGKVIMA